MLLIRLDKTKILTSSSNSDEPQNQQSQKSKIIYCSFFVKHIQEL